jgi:MFS family permease
MTATRLRWTFAITSSAWFVFALDRLVVTTALPVIRTDLGGGLAGAEWTVNAYTLTFAVLLLTGAALGDRFGRRDDPLNARGLQPRRVSQPPAIAREDPSAPPCGPLRLRQRLRSS